MDKLTLANIKRMTVASLRDELCKRGQPADGAKAKLQERLADFEATTIVQPRYEDIMAPTRSSATPIIICNAAPSEKAWTGHIAAGGGMLAVVDRRQDLIHCFDQSYKFTRSLGGGGSDHVIKRPIACALSDTTLFVLDRQRTEGGRSSIRLSEFSTSNFNQLRSFSLAELNLSTPSDMAIAPSGNELAIADGVGASKIVILELNSGAGGFTCRLVVEHPVLLTPSGVCFSADDGGKRIMVADGERRHESGADGGNIVKILSARDGTRLSSFYLGREIILDALVCDKLGGIITIGRECYEDQDWETGDPCENYRPVWNVHMPAVDSPSGYAHRHSSPPGLKTAVHSLGPSCDEFTGLAIDHLGAIIVGLHRGYMIQDTDSGDEEEIEERSALAILGVHPQQQKHTEILLDITNAIDKKAFPRALELLRSKLGEEARVGMKPAFSSVEQRLEQHAQSVANSWLDEGAALGSGAGGRNESKDKSKEKSATKELQLDDDTVIHSIDCCLKGTDDDWASLSPARLRALLIEARPGAAVSEKRIKGIKAGVLEHRAILASIESGEAVGCCICMDGLADYVLVHNDTGHQCVCKTCAERLYVSSLPCNICRQTIDYIQEASLVDRSQVTVYHDLQ